MPDVAQTGLPSVSHSRDDEYKDAIQPVIDDNMRVDVLGPRFCKVLTEHTPAQDSLVKLIATSIAKEPTIKEAVESVVEGLDTKRKSRWIDRILGAGGTALIGLIIWGIQYILTHQK
jgi:hypothetical protein